MNILQLTSALVPEFGGPVRTVPALCFNQAKLGNQVDLLYLDFGKPYKTIDLPSHPNLSYHSLKVGLNLGMRPVIIQGYREKIFEIARGKDDLIFHDNGIWLPYSRAVLKVAKSVGAKVITTTHGMLEPWAMSYGKIRKYAAWHLYQKQRLRKNNILQATSLEEANNLRRLGLDLPITIIPNGSDLPDWKGKSKNTNSDQRIILFLSRIHPKKGLLNFVNVMEQLKPVGWKAVIAGYNEGGHQEVVQEAVKNAGLEQQFSFIGPISDQHKWELYRSADLFILPSFSENFGMVVAEALASETPVITTKGTPWKDLVDYDCGWWVEPTVPSLTKCLREAFASDPEDLIKKGINGRILVEGKYSWPAIAEKVNDVYQWMIGKSQNKPGTII